MIVQTILGLVVGVIAQQHCQTGDPTCYDEGGHTLVNIVIGVCGILLGACILMASFKLYERFRRGKQGAMGTSISVTPARFSEMSTTQGIKSSNAPSSIQVTPARRHDYSREIKHQTDTPKPQSHLHLSVNAGRSPV
jgi:uncharacterized membrane protein YeaQ/YmgE (transglycosylase-associated protein family)